MPIDFFDTQTGDSNAIHKVRVKSKVSFHKFHSTPQINALLQAALNNDEFVDDALFLVATHNKCVEYTSSFNFGGVAQICCGSNTTIFLPPSRIDVKDILQVRLAANISILWKIQIDWQSF